MRHLKSAQQVVDTLGGIDAVCKLTGANRKQSWNWIGRGGMFPAWTYVDIQRALKRRNATAPARLWNMGRADKKRVA